jgi:hypothetical protein
MGICEPQHTSSPAYVVARHKSGQDGQTEKWII